MVKLGDMVSEDLLSVLKKQCVSSKRVSLRERQKSSGLERCVELATALADYLTEMRESDNQLNVALAESERQVRSVGDILRNVNSVFGKSG